MLRPNRSTRWQPWDRPNADLDPYLPLASIQYAASEYGRNPPDVEPVVTVGLNLRCSAL